MHRETPECRNLGRSVTIHLKEFSKTNKKAILGEGDVPWPEVFQVCETTGGTEWYIVEYEVPGASPLTAVAKSVENLRRLLRALLFERLVQLGLTRSTLAFDGSVQSTMRHAEGTAGGFNKKKKGARSYYPLFCTVAQTGQVLDVRATCTTRTGRGRSFWPVFRRCARPCRA